MMLNSEESISMISLPDYSTPEINVIPLTCWQNTCLSKIWIPSHLLTSRKKPLNTWATQGVFRTLQKRGHEKQIESFSVYSDSDNDSETDVFQSDSGEDFVLENNEKIRTEDDSLENLDNFAELKSFPVKSNISLNEILNSTIEVDISNFKFEKRHKHSEPPGKEVERLQPSKKSKNSKKKNKVVKSITLDKFLEDYTEEDRQSACANNYFEKMLRSKDGMIDDNEVQLRNPFEFPDLKPKKEIKFIKSEKTALEKPDITIKGIAEIISQSDKNENIYTNEAEKEVPTPEIVGKFVIENIPSEIPHEDIFSLLGGYGEVKDFSLEPDGDFQKALVKIDLICDDDWIVECLNGTEPFGASSRVLKCYKL